MIESLAGVKLAVIGQITVLAQAIVALLVNYSCLILTDAKVESHGLVALHNIHSLEIRVVLVWAE